ncbi:MAG: hypothetical protein A3H42_05430 [Deltaproteobacteria bacterium RIFCSPLOWO2_02_FULL_46_8]|nr:MAG: hypothetical protein A3H42_05430 [Deltaproteobacteria bacterium RIFCSPLOWO2_02_FULL_46_8]
MKKTFFAVTALFAFLAVSLWPAKEANAVSQWTRKYKINCQTCHTAFPRLTFYGEKFQRNGYQLPDEEDGDTTKEEINKNLFIDNLINMFGLRISVSPAKIITNNLTKPSGATTTRLSFGDPEWVQLFTAGSIFKNASIFIETEVENTTVHNNWFTLGYHNLFGQSLLNLRVGKLSVLNWFGQSGRLRMIPNINIDGMNSVRDSIGATGVTRADQVNFSSPEAGIELFGYKGPFLYSVGVVNGATLTDNNEFKNVFGTLRLEMPDGDFAGSSLSGWGYYGTDTGTTAATATIQRKDRFYRTGGAANLRWKAWDFIGAFLYQRDNNWTMVVPGAVATKNDTYIASAQLGYLINPKWFAAGQYDYTTDSRNTDSIHFNTISPSIWYMPRENMRIGFVNRSELRRRVGGRQQQFLFNVRAMF